ncbi:MAG: DUF721 domain-containing protein [Nitrospirota bacterium]|nr:DUF721 domain-containing protein [Nitrospirota bacterium]
MRRRRTARKGLRGPKRVSGLLSELASASGWGAVMESVRLRARWAELVGEQIALHTEPERISRGRLIVRVDNSAWLTQLSFFRQEIAAKVNGWLGSGRVGEVVLMVGRTEQPRIREIRPEREVSDDDRASVDELVEGLDDPEVKAALKSLLMRDLRQGRRSR